MTRAAIPMMVLVAVLAGSCAGTKTMVQEAEAPPPAKPEWGDPVDGLCARLVIKKQVLRPATVEYFDVKLELWNVSNHPIGIMTGDPGAFVKAEVTYPDGWEAPGITDLAVDTMYSRYPVPLEPGRRMLLDASYQGEAAELAGYAPPYPLGVVSVEGAAWTLPRGRYIITAAYVTEGFRLAKDPPRDAWVGTVSAPGEGIVSSLVVVPASRQNQSLEDGCRAGITA